MKPFDPDAFVQLCIDALGEQDRLAAIGEVVQRAVSDPRALQSACPLPLDVEDDGILHRSADLLITHAIFPRQYQTGIHNHLVEAAIGVWAGYEDNHFFAESAKGLRAQGVTRVGIGEVLLLDADAIHNVHTPPTAWSAALHVYLGDIVGLERFSWSTADASPTPFDGGELERRWLEAAFATGLAATSRGEK